MLGNYYYVFNVKADPFTDPEVRKAFSMVINRANIVNNIVRGGKEAAYAFVPYGMLESNGREDFREAGSYLVYEDVEQAKEILKKLAMIKIIHCRQLRFCIIQVNYIKRLPKLYKMLG